MKSKQPQTKRTRRTVPAKGALLYTRRQRARVLGGISTSTIIRLEEAGKLDPIRLFESELAQVFHSAEQVLALAQVVDTE